jgi:hypothetical protein
MLVCRSLQQQMGSASWAWCSIKRAEVLLFVGPVLPSPALELSRWWMSLEDGLKGTNDLVLMAVQIESLNRPPADRC